MQLRCGREQTVFAATGGRGDAVGDLLLHHKDSAGEISNLREEPEQNVGRNVVGQIADDNEIVARLQRAAQPG